MSEEKREILKKLEVGTTYSGIDAICRQYKEIERLNNNWKVAGEDLSRIAKLLDLEEGCTIYDIEDKIKRLNNTIENLTTMTVNGDRTQIKNTAQYKIDRAIEYHDNCVNNLLDLDKIEENERLAYRVAYEIHDNYLKILKGVDKE